MKNFFALIIMAVSIFSNPAHAILWLHQTHTGSAFGLNQMGMTEIITSQLNHYAVMWRPGDVIVINHDGQVGKMIFTGSAFSPWRTPVTTDEEQNAKAKGTIRTEEGSEGDTTCPPDNCKNDGSPLLIDLNNDGFNLGAPGKTVMFDIFAVGFKYKMQWVKEHGDEAFLAIDLNRNGKIDGGSELFGEGTRKVLSENETAQDGYDALMQYDSSKLGGNEDGKIDYNDEVWNRLVLWLDDDADGNSTPNELQTIQKSEIYSISLKYKNSRKTEEAGNRFAKWSWIEQHSSNKKARMADVYFSFVK